jgi:hypothetical protein
VTKEPDEAAPVSLNKEPDGAAPTPRPRVVTAAAAALVVSAVAALIASVVLFGQTNWLTRQAHKTNSSAVRTAVSSAVASASKAHQNVPSVSASAQASATSRYPLAGKALHHQVSQQQSGAVIGSVILVLAMAFLVVGVYRGRHWSRWGVVAFWFLASFTGTFAGISSLFAIAGSLPAAFKAPLFLSAVALLVAVVLVNLRPSTEYFASHRPARAAGAPPRRGLFAPRVPAGSAGGGTRQPAKRAETRGAVGKAVTSTAASRGEAYVQKQRAKKRAAANAESIARGAELARTRAKASKSRRIES